MTDFLEWERSEADSLFADWGLPKYQLGQVRRWIFARQVFDFDAMTDMSKATRRFLSEHCGPVLHGREIARTPATDSTEKLLIEWPDGERVECVLLRDIPKPLKNPSFVEPTRPESRSVEGWSTGKMKRIGHERNHRTACISTQVGCAMGCRFCASGMDGFVRNLTRGEILEQILRLNALLPGNERLTHLVVMGIGEPLLNLDALLSALDDATASDGLDLSVRRVTISTVGIPKGIRDLAETVRQSHKSYKLAVSLHAPNDVLRTSIIPQNRFSGISEILAATDVYFAQTGRRVTFEYTLISGVNDGEAQARELIALLKNRTAIVNVIPLNPVSELKFRTPSTQAVRRFVQQLEFGGLQVKVRFRKGDSIDAACGQLRRKHRGHQNEYFASEHDA